MGKTKTIIRRTSSYSNFSEDEAFIEYLREQGYSDSEIQEYLNSQN